MSWLERINTGLNRYQIIFIPHGLPHKSNVFLFCFSKLLNRSLKLPNPNLVITSQMFCDEQDAIETKLDIYSLKLVWFLDIEIHSLFTHLLLDGSVHSFRICDFMEMWFNWKHFSPFCPTLIFSAAVFRWTLWNDLFISFVILWTCFRLGVLLRLFSFKVVCWYIYNFPREKKSIQRCAVFSVFSFLLDLPRRSHLRSWVFPLLCPYVNVVSLNAVFTLFS